MMDRLGNNGKPNQLFCSPFFLLNLKLQKYRYSLPKEQTFSQCADCIFKSTKKLNHDILGWLNKSKTAGHCIFPLTNLHSGESVYYVPKSNLSNILILL